MTVMTAVPRVEVRPLPGLRADLAATFVFLVLLAARPDSPLVITPLLAYLAFWPGDALRRAVGVAVTRVAERVVLAVGSSLVVLMGLTIVVEGLSLLIGVGRPFAYGPLAWGAAAVSVVSLLAAHRVGAAPPGPWLPRAHVWVLTVALVAPLLVMGGARWVDDGRGPGLSLLGFGVIVAASAAVLVRSRRDAERSDSDLTVLVFALSLSVAWSFSLRTPYLFGFDLHQELATINRVLGSAVWAPRDDDAYNASLGLSSVPTTLVTLTGLSPLLLLKGYYTLFLAVLPTTTFLIASRRLGLLSASTLALLLALNPVGYWQIATIARQELALAVFAALLLVLVDVRGDRAPRLALALVLGAGVVLAHYSTAYLAIAVLVGGWAVAWLARRWTRAPASSRAVPLWLPLTMLVLAFLWGHVLNQSTQNVDRTAQQSVSTPGLRDQGSLLDTWLKGGLTTSTTGTPAELFASATTVAADRPWLRPYSSAVQDQFAPQAASVPDPRPWVPGLVAPVRVLFTVLRQLVLLAIGLSSARLLWLVLRRREVDAETLPLVGLAVGAAALSVVVRVNAGLASAYNAERLVIQLAPLYVLGLCLAWRTRPAPVRRRSPSRLLVSGLAIVALFAAAVDAVGVRGLLTGDSAAGLRSDDEYALRFAETTQDAAAAAWLVDHFANGNQVYADRYAALFLRDSPTMRSGVFDTLLPALLDQRAFVFASTENVLGGRARGQIAGLLAIYAYPDAFLDRYKTVAYDNGSARVFD